jgi:hypothetical protein
MESAMSLTPIYRPGRELLVAAPSGSQFALAEIRVIGWHGKCRSILRYSVGFRARSVEQKVVDIRKVPELRGITDGMPYRTRERLHHIASAVLEAVGRGKDAITSMAQVGDPLDEAERLPALAGQGGATSQGEHEQWILARMSAAPVMLSMESP